MFFICVQLLGFIGWILLVLSYWRKDINGVLSFQLISGFFYALHYYFLGAWEGLFIIVFELFRDFSYYKTDWDKYIFILTIPIYIIVGFLEYNGIVSIYPIIASFVEGFSLTFKKSIAVVGAIISSGLWMVYDYRCGSYVGLVTCFILLISNFIVLLKDNEKVYRKVK